VDPGLYDEHAAEWWDEGSRFFRSLRSVHRFHLALLREELGERIPGALALDLGCGGGLFALALAELGARVIGVDLAPRGLAAGRAEAARRGADCRFLRGDVRRLPLADRSADLVLLPDVIEHVPAPERAIAEAGRVLRPGGVLFASTFDRGLLPGFLVVRLAEGLGLVPRGTHDPRLFVRPAELVAMGARTGLLLQRLQRESLALWPTLLSWTVRLRRATRGFGYSVFLRKERAASAGTRDASGGPAGRPVGEAAAGRSSRPRAPAATAPTPRTGP